MNYIWAGMMIISIITGLFCGNVSAVMTAGLNGAKDAISAIISFGGMMLFWSGMLSVFAQGGLMDFFKRILTPILARLFPNTSATSDIVMNVVANLLGMGNAATPPGIRAMQILDSESKSSCPSRMMSVFAIMNTASLQIIPTTVAAMRSASGAKNPFDILVPVWIVSLLSFFGALSVIILWQKQ